MTVEAAIHGQEAAAGTPAKGRAASATTPEPIEMSVVVESGSSPTLISAFQPAWHSAANRTARKTAFSNASHLRRGWRPQLRPGALVLHRTLDLGAERLGRVPAPMRVVEKGARQRHHVGLALRHDVLGLLRCQDEADRAGRNGGLLFHPRCNRDIVAGLGRVAGVGADAARRNADEID